METDDLTRDLFLVLLRLKVNPWILQDGDSSGVRLVPLAQLTGLQKSRRPCRGHQSGCGRRLFPLGALARRRGGSIAADHWRTELQDRRRLEPSRRILLGWFSRAPGSGGDGGRGCHRGGFLLAASQAFEVGDVAHDDRGRACLVRIIGGRIQNKHSVVVVPFAALNWREIQTELQRSLHNSETRNLLTCVCYRSLA